MTPPDDMRARAPLRDGAALPPRLVWAPHPAWPLLGEVLVMLDALSEAQLVGGVIADGEFWEGSDPDVYGYLDGASEPVRWWLGSSGAEHTRIAEGYARDRASGRAAVVAVAVATGWQGLDADGLAVWVDLANHRRGLRVPYRVHPNDRTDDN